MSWKDEYMSFRLHQTHTNCWFHDSDAPTLDVVSLSIRYATPLLGGSMPVWMPLTTACAVIGTTSDWSSPGSVHPGVSFYFIFMWMCQSNSYMLMVIGTAECHVQIKNAYQVSQVHHIPMLKADHHYSYFHCIELHGPNNLLGLVEKVGTRWSRQPQIVMKVAQVEACCDDCTAGIDPLL